MRTITLLLLVGSSACASMEITPPRSLVELEPATTLEERKEQANLYTLTPALKTTTTVTTNKYGASTNVTHDLSVLAQDGNYYKIEEYLPELQKVGIATEVKDTAKALHKVKVGGATALGSVFFTFMPILLYRDNCGDYPNFGDYPGGILGQPYADALSKFDECRALESNTNDQIASLSYLAVAIGATIGSVIWYDGARMYQKQKKIAERDRAAWARKWNKKLMEKLKLQEAPSVTKP